MKTKHTDFTLVRKTFDYSTDMPGYDFIFQDTNNTGFCGRQFVELFPQAEVANTVTLRVSHTRLRKKGERAFTVIQNVDESLRDGVLVNHQADHFVHVLDDALNHIKKSHPFVHRDRVYVQVIVES